MPDPVTGVILAGGRARRMGGRDKGLVPLQGRSLVQHVATRLAPQVDELLINANRNLAAYGALGWPVVADTLPDRPGPLAGILAASRRARHPWLLAVPCDAPRLPLDLAARLLAALRTSHAVMAVAHDGRRLQPAHVLLRTTLADDLEYWLRQGGRRLEQWLSLHQAVQVDFSDQPEAFVNLNTLAERDALGGR